VLGSSFLSAAEPLRQPTAVRQSPVGGNRSLAAPLQWRQAQSKSAGLTAAPGTLPVRRPTKRHILPVVVDKKIIGRDPFADPFGDLEQTTDRPLEILQPARETATQPAAQPVESLPAPIRLPSTPSTADSFPLAEIFPQETATDNPEQATGDPGSDCEQLDCVRMRQQLEHTSLRDISLNITPRFRPNTQEARPKSSESRVWKDSQGRDLVTGALVDYRFNHVLIKPEDGQAIEVATDRLSEKDLCYLAAAWGIPAECTLNTDLQYSRNWVPLTMTWKASALCHKPLYFEQIQLERYGHTSGPWSQPFLSGGHFILNIAALPYKMGINPMNECQYALGYYRPGSCAPWLLSPIPLSLQGAAAEAGAIFGGGALFP